MVKSETARKVAKRMPLRSRPACQKALKKPKQEDQGLLAKAGDYLYETIGSIFQDEAMLEGILAKAAGAIDTIPLNPMAFLSNLLAAVKGGFEKFASNIGMHLEKGRMSWSKAEPANALDAERPTIKVPFVITRSANVPPAS